MLKFGSNSIQWADISEVNITSGDEGHEVSVVANEVALTVGTYMTTSQADKIKILIEAGRSAASVGGVLITVIIDDL